jgi:hypothetical protein
LSRIAHRFPPRVSSEEHAHNRLAGCVESAEFLFRSVPRPAACALLIYEV